MGKRIFNNMKRLSILLLLPILLLWNSCIVTQGLPSRWDELTASDWPKALEKSSRTCILPIGILEKHGPHAPVGSDTVPTRSD